MPRDPKLLTPIVTIAITHDGRQVLLRQGRTLVRSGHPITIGREHLFEPVRVDYDIEQATAAPGEKRTVKLPEPEPKPTREPDEGDKQAD